MTTYSGKFESLLSLLQPKYGVKVAFKDKSIFMKILSVFIYPFNQRFMSGFATTIGKTVYFPSLNYVNKYDKEATAVLAHETVHIYDSKNLFWFGNIGYTIGYLFPQILSLFSLLAIAWTDWWLLTLVFLLPMPAYFRAKIECRAYAMSIWFSENPTPASQILNCVTSFCGLNYYCAYTEAGRFRWVDRFNKYSKKLIGKHPVFINVAIWKSGVSK